MSQVHQALAVVTDVIRAILGVFLGVFGVIEHWAGELLTRIGVTGVAQRWVMLAVTVVFIVAVLRVFGGFFRLILTVFLLLLLLDLILPAGSF